MKLPENVFKIKRNLVLLIKYNIARNISAKNRIYGKETLLKYTRYDDFWLFGFGW